MKRTLFAILFLLACVAGVSAQEAEFSSSGGTAGAITAAPGSGTAGRIPQFASATSVVDSKMLTSGTNSGTWTLYDDTATVGASTLNIRIGAGQDDSLAWYPLLNVLNNAGSAFLSNPVIATSTGGNIQISATSFRDGTSADAFLLSSSAMDFGSGVTVRWGDSTLHYSTRDIGLARSAAGILKVTDGSTGSGDLWAGNIGVGATAVNTTGLYVKATTGMTSNLYLEGTGGIINPVITFVDVGPTTGSITWQSPQMELRGGSGHYMSLDLSSTPKILFGDNADDAGIAWVSGSTLKITDGSTGSGGIGISDAATNTVTDALILRHATSGTAAASFGTGLLFQGEDASGNMQDMASIDAVYTDATDASEDAKLQLLAMSGGALAEAAAFDVDSGNPRLTFNGSFGLIRASADLIIQPVGKIYFTAESAVNAWIMTNASYSPGTTNAYDFGTSSAFVKDSYLGTSIQGTRTKTLTDNTITDVVQISSTAEANANGVTAGHVSYTIVASDATTDIVQTETGNVPFLLVNENGTVTVTLGTVYGTAIDSAGGAALANTFASSVTGTNAMIRVTSNYDQATLTGTVTHDIRYRVYIDSGTATVTPQ